MTKIPKGQTGDVQHRAVSRLLTPCALSSRIVLRCAWLNIGWFLLGWDLGGQTAYLSERTLRSRRPLSSGTCQASDAQRMKMNLFFDVSVATWQLTAKIATCPWSSTLIHASQTEVIPKIVRCAIHAHIKKQTVAFACGRKPPV